MNLLNRLSDTLQHKLQKVGLVLSILFLISFVFFAYTGSIEIDEGTEALYQTLNQLMIISLVLLIIIGTPTAWQSF